LGGISAGCRTIGGGGTTLSQFKKQKARPKIMMNRPSISIKGAEAAGCENVAAENAESSVMASFTIKPTRGKYI
jgi:hypothetical protein